MSCACFNITWEKVKEDNYEISWERFCDSLVDLVPFSAADGRFFTAEGYTIIVKK